MQDNSSSTAVLDMAEPAAAQATQVTSVPALHYTQLRLLAECAVANNREVDFYFKDGEALYEGQPTGESADADVVTYSSESGRHPRNQVTLEAEYEGRMLRLDLEMGMDDALFWADAAVQKFIFPYLASCGGDSGAAVLQNLQDAWNDYPTEQVSVYALVQQSWLSPSGPLDLDLAIQVVHVAHPVPQTVPPTEPTLQMTTLRAFRQKYTPVLQEREAIKAPYSRGISGVPQRPNYTALRAMADWACSLRGQPEYFVFRAGGKGFENPLPTKLPTDLAPGDFVVPALTPAVPANRPDLTKVLLHSEGSTAPPRDLVAEKADALFWSTGSIEQFLFPYYASKTGFAGMSKLVDMIYAWTGDMPVLSQNPEVNALVDSLLRESAPPEPTGDQVAGLIHLHTSEWVEITVEEQIVVTQTDQVDPTRQLGVVSVDNSGNHAVERMDRFIARKRAGQ
jgi:hypothetical protein